MQKNIRVINAKGGKYINLNDIIKLLGYDEEALKSVSETTSFYINNLIGKLEGLDQPHERRIYE